MGNDGGSIPGRKDLVKEKGKDKKSDNNALVRKYKSRYCALTKEPLIKPVMGDKLGFLYNKEPLIRALIEKRLPRNFMHITSLKDLKDLKITLSDDEDSKIICPVSMIDFSGLNCFYILWNCGCVISKKALEELEMSCKCLNCNSEVNCKTDLVSLNYTTKERENIFKQILQEKKNNSSSNKNSSNSNRDSIINLNKMLNKKRELLQDEDLTKNTVQKIEKNECSKIFKKQKLDDQININN
jgi:hypothetical protein